MDPKNKIIERSLDLFLQNGCKSVTMDQVAHENGISKRTLYEIFTDKSQLLEECIQLMYSQMKESAVRFNDSSVNVIDVLFTIHETHSDVLLDLKKNFFMELKRYYYSVYKKSVNNFIEFHKTKTHDFIVRGQKEGLIRADLNVDLVSKVIIEISNILDSSDFYTLKNYSRKELFREVVISYLRGISTIDGVNLIDEKLAFYKR